MKGLRITQDLMVQFGTEDEVDFRPEVIGKGCDITMLPLQLAHQCDGISGKIQ